MTVLNEAVIRGTRHILHDCSMALYVHVDDVVVLGCSDIETDQLLKHIITSLVQIGFTISQQVYSSEMKKTLGYELCRATNCLQFPLGKNSVNSESYARTSREEKGRGGYYCFHRRHMAIWRFT